MLYECKIQLHSSVGTPFHSDTIWGHLAWHVKYLFGENRLKEFLESYDGSPTLVSNGFPEDYLPMPVLPAMQQTEMHELLEEFFPGSREGRMKGRQRIKSLRKSSFIPESVFAELQGNLSEYHLLRQLLLNRAPAETDPTRGVREIQPHNTIDRMTFGTPKRGGLFFEPVTFYPPDMAIRIFVQSDFFTRDELTTIFESIGLSGFGRDASTGKGAFRLRQLEEGRFPQYPQTNAFMSLSNFVPSNDLPLTGFYQLITKYGKLGGDFVLEKKVPFKKPIVMMAAGSIFVNVDEDRVYGTLLTDVHYHSSEIVHFGYLFPYPVYVQQ